MGDKVREEWRLSGSSDGLGPLRSGLSPPISQGQSGPSSVEDLP